MKKKKIVGIVALLGLMITLAGCQNIRMWFKGFQEEFVGLKMTIQTYDEQSQIIDRITGKSVSIERDSEFDSDEDSADSSVLSITVGNKELHHVGSSMIVAEEGLEDIFSEYSQTVDLDNLDRSVPLVNRMVKDMQNSFTGRKKVILIRSQQGFPLATYAGDKVSLYSTDVPKSTGILVDGKYLFIYRCDYTIYDASLLEE